MDFFNNSDGIPFQ